MDTEKKEAQVQNQDLTELRSRIDQIDREIVRLYEERMQVTDEVGEFKIRTGRKVYDKDRERAKIETVRGLAHSDFTRKGVAELFSQLMSMSRKRQFAMLEKAGFEVKRMFIQALCRDSNLRTAAERGITKPIYIIPINRISNHWLNRYFGKKAKMLHNAIQKQQLPPPCSIKENWGGRKCLEYCDAKENCPHAQQVAELLHGRAI